jgi:hypothetical protein
MRNLVRLCVLSMLLLAVGYRVWPSSPPQAVGPRYAAGTATPPPMADPQYVGPTDSGWIGDPKVATYQDEFRTVIVLGGYACPQVNAGWEQGQGPYGLAFRVSCDTGHFQVILRPNDQFVVRTWANRLK